MRLSRLASAAIFLVASSVRAFAQTCAPGELRVFVVDSQQGPVFDAQVRIGPDNAPLDNRLTGTQGVIVPAANRVNLVLRDDVAAAVAEGRFHLWSVSTVEDALALLLGRPAGSVDVEGRYPQDSIFGLVAARLAAFDRILAKRRIAGSP